MGVLVFCQHKKKIVVFLKHLQFRGLILPGAKSPVVLLELISHRIISAVTQTAWVRMMTDTFLQRKGDREGDGMEHKENDYHTVT